MKRRQTALPGPAHRTLSLALYRLLTRLGAPVFRQVLNARAARGKEDPTRLSERFGHPGGPRPPGTLVWIHGVSVGESLSALPLIDRLLAQDPHLNVLMTSGTTTSAALLAKRLPARAFHQYVPVDTVGAVRRFLDFWQPDLALFMESELWPNLILETSARDVPMALLNARMSEHSFTRWLRARGTARALLSRFTLCLAQDTAIGGRLESLGARNIEIVGNLKYAADPLPADDKALEAMKAALGGRPAWLCSSTHDGEEAQIAHVHASLKEAHPGVLTIIVPRHPDRGDQIAELMADMGHAPAQRSKNEPISPQTDIYIADTMGELGLFYRLVDIAFVGGSLIPHGGQNPLEPARLHCAVVTGPNTENFHAIYRDLTTAGAAEYVQNRDQLAAFVGRLLSDPQDVTARAEAGLKVCGRADSVISRVMDSLKPLLTPLLRGGPQPLSQTPPRTAAQ